MADAARAVFFLGALTEVSSGEDAAVAKWAFGNGGLGVLDEDVERITDSGFFHRLRMDSRRSRALAPAGSK